MEEKGIIGKYKVDGNPVILKFVNELPEPDFRVRFRWLTVISWPYDGAAQNGMPSSEEQEGMKAIEQAVERAVVEKDVGVHAYSRTGNNLKELVYYIIDRDDFIARFNDALSGQPRYPIEINFYEDEHWQDFQKILDQFNRKVQ